MFSVEEFDDTVQNVNEALFQKLQRIREQYNGSALVKTYVSAIIRNICLKLHEAKGREPRSTPLNEHMEADPEEFDERSLHPRFIEHARGLFRAILVQFDHKDQLPKLLLYLKLRYRLILSADDIQRWYPRCGRSDLDSLLESFGRPYEQMEDREVYRIFTPVANKAGGKLNSDDAIRKWTRTRIEEILELLNGSPATSSFDEESLGLLVEDYFSPFLNSQG
jgi:hypothetical protein